MDPQTYSDLQNALRKSLQEQHGNEVYISDVFIYKNEVVFEKGEKLFRTAYKIDDRGETVLADAAVEVIRETSYLPAHAPQKVENRSNVHTVRDIIK